MNCAELRSRRSCSVAFDENSARAPPKAVPKAADAPSAEKLLMIVR